MKTLRLLILPMLILAGLLQGCTHNNGDIGPLFGNWKLTEASGLPQGAAPKGIFWAFQSSVVQLLRNDGYAESTIVYGNWHLDEENLILDFPDEDYAPLPELALPRQCSLQVEYMSRSRLKLTYTNADGGTQTYVFIKW